MNDANAVIAVGRKYVLTWDAMSEIYGGSLEIAYSIASFYYGGEPDADGNVVATASYPLPVWIGDLNEWEHEWEPNLTLKWVATAGHPALGETLGLRWFSPSPGGPVRAYTTTENVRLEWVWATDAYDPVPEDGAEDVARDVNLAWSPGLWSDRHIVYFSDDFNKVNDLLEDANQGIQDVNIFDPTPGSGQLDLVKTYYWRIVEVNAGYVHEPGIPDPPWEGDVWSFTITGFATNPNPEDGAKNVSVYTDLSWTPGTDSDEHDVYFGTNIGNVTDANIDVNFGVYMGRYDTNDFNDFVPALELGGKYYWRIDEVNVITIKGKVWSFTVADHLTVDDFESYADDAAIKAVWKDKWTGSIALNGAEVFLEAADANKFLATGGKSMRYYYRNFEMSGGNPVGSTDEASIADLPVDSNWIANGVKALMVNFCGDTANGQEADASYTIANDRMWMSLEDGVGNEGIKRYPDMNHVTDGAWHEWNIELADPCFSSVGMSDIAKVYIGFGGVKGGATSKYGAGYVDAVGDTVWFDDIRLYPPRCRVEIAYSAGNFDYDDDCVVNYQDLYALAGYDWLASGIGMVTATAPNPTGLIGRWSMDEAVAGGGSKNVVDDTGLTGSYDGTLIDPDNDPGDNT
ncbi:MAG: hypothetical protein ACYS21_18085, partial [Planctomycetota bacterium]